MKTLGKAKLMTYGAENWIFKKKEKQTNKPSTLWVKHFPERTIQTPEQILLLIKKKKNLAYYPKKGSYTELYKMWNIS